MIKERMLELHLGLQIAALAEEQNYVAFQGKTIDFNKLNARLEELLEEFLDPYLIDSTSKED